MQLRARLNAAGTVNSKYRPNGRVQPVVARRVRANAVQPPQALAEEGEIDPTTGMVIARTSTLNPVAGYSLKVGNLNWAYRAAEVEGEPLEGVPDVLLIHGLGSSSYSYRNTVALLGGAGIRAVALDWIGHGDSDKPAPGSTKFDYSGAAYFAGLSDFVENAQATGLLRKPFAMVVQGSITSQYALLWAAQHPTLVDKLVILNTPLSSSCKLRPELAAYKNPIPFLRPKADAPFDGMTFNMSGSPYAMEERDAMAYGRPYRDDPAASGAVWATMDALPSFPDLIKRVDDAFIKWRQPSLLLFGSSDPFVDNRSAFEFLESKRTNMKTTTVAAKLGHMPQEDFADAIHEPLMAFLRGEELKTGKVPLKMTKRGLEGA